MQKIAIVTGGSKGLGKEISLNLNKAGYKVYAVSRNPEEINRSVISEKVDITDQRQCKKLVSKIVDSEKRLDLLVNNAGNSKGDLNDLINLNLLGTVNITKFSYSYLKKNKGRIINITSLNALVPTPNSAEYCASKHAVDAYFISLSYTAKKDGIYITNVAPGAIYNPYANKMSYKTIRERFPLLKKLYPMVTKELIAREVTSIAKMKFPPRRVILGSDTKLSVIISRLFPNLWFKVIDFIYK